MIEHLIITHYFSSYVCSDLNLWVSYLAETSLKKNIQFSQLQIYLLYGFDYMITI